MESSSREHARASPPDGCEVPNSLDRESALRESKIPPNAPEAEGRYLAGESVGQSSDSEAPSAAAPGSGLGVGSPPIRRGAPFAPRDRAFCPIDSGAHMDEAKSSGTATPAMPSLFEEIRRR